MSFLGFVDVYLAKFLSIREGLLDLFPVKLVGNAHHYVTYTRGEPPYVLLNAHLDTVQDDLDWEKIAQGLRLRNGVWRAPGARIGGDDKCGLAIIAAILENPDLPCKVLLTTNEEQGAPPLYPEGFLDDCSFAVVLDRRGSADIVTSWQGRPTCPLALGYWIVDCARDLHRTYTPTEGGWSHVIGLGSVLPAVNLSVGFHHEHTPEELVKVRETQDTARLVESLLVRRGEVDSEGFPYSDKYCQPPGVIAHAEACLGPARELVLEFRTPEGDSSTVYDEKYHGEDWYRTPVWIVRQDAWRNWRREID